MVEVSLLNVCIVLSSIRFYASPQFYAELMGPQGSYYLLREDDDTIFSDGTSAAQETSDHAETIVAAEGCRYKIYELMGQKGSYYLLLKLDDTNTHLGEPQINLAVNSNQEALYRRKVRGVLNLFQKTLKERLLEKQVTGKSKGKTKTLSADIYEEVAILLKQHEWIYMNERVLEAIQGVEAGDQFQYRAQLAIVGLHVRFVADIDYMEKDSKKIATSIVSIRCYSDDKELTDVIYCCEGSNETMVQRNSKDQKLVHKFALKNSMDEESLVRVFEVINFRREKALHIHMMDYYCKQVLQKRRRNGKLVCMFQLNKMPGQPKLKVDKLGRHGKSKAPFYRTLIDDISYGKEKISISVVNDIDNDKPPIFNYITKMVYPKSANARGCQCIDGCSDHVQCSCVVKNGGVVPFNEDGAVVRSKRIIHECSPSCKCPPSCINRVSQHGLKIQLEVFKKRKREGGVFDHGILFHPGVLFASMLVSCLTTRKPRKG